MEINSKELYNFYTLKNYQCQIKAVEVITEKPVPKKKRKWIYVVSLVDNEKTSDDKTNVIEVPSLHEYSTPEDAIQDAYGITRLLGFIIINLEDSSRLEVFVLNWDHKQENYKVNKIYYDGMDFFPTETEG